MRVFFNEDWIHFLATRYRDGIYVTEDVLREFIYQYKDTAVTDFMMNVNGTVSTFPSRVLESYCQKYIARTENGFPVDYSDTFASTAYRLFEEEKIDMYAVWIDALREIGIRPWMSVRMNDCHNSLDNTALRKSSQMDKYPELWRTPYRRPDYYGRCMDYALPKVREIMLDYISEVLERYDVDGLELDFMREMMLFAPGHEDRDILTQFMEQVKKLVTEAESRYGHKIALSVIVATDPEVCFEAGLDVHRWSQMKLVDMVCAIPRWETITTNAPVELWKSLLGETSLSIGQQILVMSYRGGYWTMSSIDMAYGQAAANLSRGADHIYLYNYMDDVDPGLEIFCHDTAIRKHQEEFLKNLNEKALRAHMRRYPLTFNDYLNYWSPVAYSLPLDFKEEDALSSAFPAIRISTGDLSGNTALLQLGIHSEEILQATDFEIYVNGKKPEFAEPAPDNNIYKKQWYAFRLDTGNITRHALIEFRIKKTCRVEYMEICAI